MKTFLLAVLSSNTINCCLAQNWANLQFNTFEKARANDWNQPEFSASKLNERFDTPPTWPHTQPPSPQHSIWPSTFDAIDVDFVFEVL
jgi:hypothetical protein